MLIPFLSGVLTAFWFLFVLRYLGLNGDRSGITWKRRIRIQLAERFNPDRYQGQAAKTGHGVTRKELVFVFFFSASVAAIIAVLINNPLVLIIGIAAGWYLPGFLIEQKKQYYRAKMISTLTDPLRMLLAKLPDQQNIAKALERTRNETGDEEVRRLLDGCLQDAAIMGSIQEALLNLKKRVALRKIDIFLDYLVQANYEGFTAEAMQALNKSLEAIEYDLRAIGKVKEQSRAKKRALYSSLAVTWLFPLILSMANTGEKNIYLETAAGKVLMLFYITGSLYVVIKGEEYLSLNLNEL